MHPPLEPFFLFSISKILHWKKKLVQKGPEHTRHVLRQAWKENKVHPSRKTANKEWNFCFLPKFEHFSPSKYPTSNNGEPCPTSKSPHFYASWTCLASKLVNPLHPWAKHKNPKKHNIILHNSLAIRQCKRKWLEDSPALLHKQHLSTTSRRFLKLSLVKILPNTIVLTKKLILEGTSELHTVFHRKGIWEGDL